MNIYETRFIIRKLKQERRIKYEIYTEVQFQSHNVLVADVEKAVKEDIKSKGVKLNSLSSLEIYYQPENLSVFYVAKAKDGTSISNEEPLSLE